MSDAARSARLASPVAASVTAAPALVVVTPPPAPPTEKDPAEVVADALAAAVAGGGTGAVRTTIEAQPTQTTVLLELAAEPDLYRLSAVAAEHGAAIAALTRRDGMTCVAVLLARPLRGGGR